MKIKKTDSPLRKGIKIADSFVNFIALILLLLMFAYSAYSIWYSQSIVNGSFISDEIAAYRPDGEKPTLKDLMKINPDVAAWITIPKTRIDYPVVQGEDDSDYLNKDVMGEFSFAGAIFMSSLNKRDFNDSYIMIYGHHVQGGAMFSDVMSFREKSYFEEHPSGILWYEDSADRIEFFACVEAAANNSDIYKSYNNVAPEDIPKIFEKVNEMAVQRRNMQVDENSRIVALSTCEDAVSFNRVILFGKLTEMTSEEIAEAQAEEKATEIKVKKSYKGIITGICAGLILIILILLYVRFKKK